MRTTQTLWENLHAQARFRPLYPHEAVVRFLMTQFPHEIDARKNLRVLDLGCGAGRHTLLFAEQGFRTYATDFSLPGLKVTRERLAARELDAELAIADMHALPFADAALDGIIAFGVLYYNDWNGVQCAVQEMRRVLNAGGKAHIVTRTTGDYRCGKGERIDTHSYCLNIAETNERDMVMCFLERADVTALFENFSRITVDRIEYTTDEWRVDSDWIITVTK
ncbi:MAG TPA: class I SAM-dependent methyltransferase [Anaerolineae bacterium]|nr:class I SAM-dependent methyltransferase [Anaerolineae bacterium]